jgi:hypothetical protein
VSQEHLIRPGTANPAQKAYTWLDIDPNDTIMPGDDKSALAHEMSVASSSPSATSARRASMAPEYRTYKRRWFGLIQLILLNIVVSWDVRLSGLHRAQEPAY